MTETLKIPDSVLYGGESPMESLNDAVMFWQEYLGQNEVWSISGCQFVYDELLQLVISDIQRLDLTYKVKKTNSNEDDSLNSLLSMTQSQHAKPLQS